MAMMFLDSFDHYADTTLKWSIPGPNSGFSTIPGTVRTGIQSLIVNGASGGGGPILNFAVRNTLIVGMAFQTDGFDITPDLFLSFRNSAVSAVTVGLYVTQAGAIEVAIGNEPVQIVIGTSAPNLVTADVYCYVECEATFMPNPTGSVIVRVNEIEVLNLQGVTTTAGGVTGSDGFQLGGEGTRIHYFDDLYLFDSTGSVNNTFAGAVQIFALVPNANETPLAFVPLAGTNFSEVNQIPPPGDASYVSSSTIGAIDQYQHKGDLPAGAYSMSGLQHVICCRLDAAGAHTVQSQIGANTGSVLGSPGATYKMIIQPWDTNPETGLGWRLSDLNATFMGPSITA
jgi:hypothetical protein